MSGNFRMHFDSQRRFVISMIVFVQTLLLLGEAWGGGDAFQPRTSRSAVLLRPVS
jgi:hypothetical protein